MKRPETRTILICVGLFLLFVLIQFPFKNFRGKLFETIYKQSRVHITADDMGLSLFGWPGITLTNVDINALPAGFVMGAEYGVLRVGIGQIWPFALSYTGAFDGLSSGGDVWFRFVDGGKNYYIAAESDDLGAELITFYGRPPAVQGKLNLDAEVDYQMANVAASKGYVEVKGTNINLAPQNYPPYFSLVDTTKIGPAKILINLNNGVAEIAQFELGEKGSDLQAKISGQVILGRTWKSSQVKVRVDITLSPEFSNSPKSKDLKAYLSTFQLSSGSYAMRWDKTIQAMMTNPLDAFPQTVQ